MRKTKPDANTPNYGGTTFAPDQVMMTDGPRWSSATRHPDGTITVRVVASPLRRLRLFAVRIPLLRGIVLHPTQVGIVIGLGAQNRTPPHEGGKDTPSAQELAVVVSLGLLLASLLPRVIVVLAAVAIGGGGLVSVMLTTAGVVIGAVVMREFKRAQRARPGLLKLHGAEHQALNCVRGGLALTEDDIAASTTASPTCGDASLSTARWVAAAVMAWLATALPSDPSGTQLLWTVGGLLAARAVSFELDPYLPRRRLGGAAGQGFTLPSGPEDRELAARALEPLLPPDQQAQVGPFPSPVRLVSSSSSALEGNRAT